MKSGEAKCRYIRSFEQSQFNHITMKQNAASYMFLFLCVRNSVLRVFVLYRFVFARASLYRCVCVCLCMRVCVCVRERE